MNKTYLNTRFSSYLIFVSILIGLSQTDLYAQTSCTPVLLLPENGAELDNGCDKQIDLELWEFDWQDCVGSTKYHLYAIRSGAKYPVINADTLLISEFTFSMEGYILDRNRLDWKWKVRAMNNDTWGEWSEERSFDVEPLNTDCTITAIYPWIDNETQINVFPNPAINLISIELQDELANNVGEMRLIQMTGAKIYRYSPTNIRSGVIDLDVNFVPAGIYALTIEVGSRNIVIKVIIQK